jgi:hypothetical protein
MKCVNKTLGARLFVQLDISSNAKYIHHEGIGAGLVRSRVGDRLGYLYGDSEVRDQCYKTFYC